MIIFYSFKIFRVVVLQYEIKNYYVIWINLKRHDSNINVVEILVILHIMFIC